MVSHKVFRGGAIKVSISVDTEIFYSPEYKLYAIFATTTGLEVTLPDLDARETPEGMKVGCFMNFGANAFDLVDQNGLSRTVTVAGGVGAFCWVGSFVDAQGGSPITGKNWMFRSSVALL